MRFISLLVILILSSGCTFLQEKDPNFDSPLISVCTEKPPTENENKVWVEAKTSRIWVNPQVDAGGDLEEGHYKDIVLMPGHWVVNGKQGSQQ